MPAPARPAPTTTAWPRGLDAGARLRGPRLCPGGGDRHVPFAAIAGFTARVETGFGQCPTQLAGAGPGGQGRAGRCHGGQFAQQRRFPCGLRPGAKPSRKYASTQASKRGATVCASPKAKVSVTAPPSPEPVQARQRQRPLGRQLARQAGQRPARGAPTAQPDPPERRDGLRPPARAAPRCAPVVAPCPPQRQKFRPSPNPVSQTVKASCRASVPAGHCPAGIHARPGPAPRRRMVDVAIGRTEPAFGIEGNRRRRQGNIRRRHEGPGFQQIRE